MTDEIKNKLKTVIPVLAALAGYYLLRRFTPFYIPCPIHAITGFKCPGCGVTRMFLALMRLDFKSAFDSNPFVLVTLPYLIFAVVYEFFLPHNNKKVYKLNNIILTIYCIALVAFGVLRNIYGL